MPRVIHVAFVLSAVLVLSAPPVIADPIAVTSGRIELQPPGGFTAFIDITAPGLRIFQDEIEAQPIVVAPLPSPVTGALMDLSAFTVNGSGESPVFGTLGNGTRVEVTGPMSFHAGSASLTCGTLAIGALQCESARAPFTFDAHFTLTTADRDVFTRDLIGSGTVVGRFTPEGQDHALTEVLTYTFASPTPEPATWMLLAAGVAALPTLRRRRRGVTS